MWQKKRNILLFIIFIASLFAYWVYFKPITFERDMLYIQSDQRMWPFDVELAKSNAQQELGLMNRSALGRNAGMLFIFPEEKIASMWMKNTVIRLDMLFIDRNGKILFIAANTKPKSTQMITANRPVKAVLELKGGITKFYNIKIGDQIIHPVFNNIGY